MKVKIGLTGETSLQIPIQNPTSILLLQKRGSALFGDEMLSLTLNKKTGGAIELIPMAKVKRCAVMSQFGLGYQLHQKVSDGVFFSAYAIRLTPDGLALELNDDNSLVLNLSGLDSNATYDIYAVEQGATTRQAFKQSGRTYPVAEPQQIELGAGVNPSALFLTNNGALDSIRVSYKGGRQCSYTVPELLMYARLKNDLTFASDILSTASNATAQAISGGGADLLIVSMVGVESFILNTSGTAELGVIQQSVVSY